MSKPNQRSPSERANSGHVKSDVTLVLIGRMNSNRYGENVIRTCVFPISVLKSKSGRPGPSVLGVCAFQFILAQGFGAVVLGPQPHRTAHVALEPHVVGRVGCRPRC